MAKEFVLDKAVILARLGGDDELFAAMAGMYLQESEKYCAQVAAALAGRDGPLLQREAHTIKSLLATFADGNGADLALAIEQRAASGDLSGLEERVVELQQRLRRVAAALEEMPELLSR